MVIVLLQTIDVLAGLPIDIPIHIGLVVTAHSVSALKEKLGEIILLQTILHINQLSVPLRDIVIMKQAIASAVRVSWDWRVIV
jgi:hypothetical protein